MDTKELKEKARQAISAIQNMGDENVRKMSNDLKADADGKLQQYCEDLVEDRWFPPRNKVPYLKKALVGLIQSNLTGSWSIAHYSLQLSQLQNRLDKAEKARQALKGCDNDDLRKHLKDRLTSEKNLSFFEKVHIRYHIDYDNGSYIAICKEELLQTHDKKIIGLQEDIEKRKQEMDELKNQLMKIINLVDQGK